MLDPVYPLNALTDAYGLLRSRCLDIGQVLFCVLKDREGVEVHKLTKKERSQYPDILAEQTWSINDLLMAFG